MRSRRAFHRVFSVFYPKVYAFALGFIKNEADAEDVTQMVFINLWTKREKLLSVENLDADRSNESAEQRDCIA